MRHEPAWRLWLILGLPLLWLVLFFLGPFAILAKISLSEAVLAQPPYRPILDFGLDAERWRVFAAALSLDNYRLLASDDLYVRAGLSSLAMASAATALLLAFGYPVALAMARAPARLRPLLVALVVVPFWTSLVVRTYAWIAILKTDGLLNAALGLVGLPPLAMLDTNAAVVLGLVYAYLPFMVLPLYAVLERADLALVEAASDLGASPRGAFWSVTMPLSLPGVAAGVLLCFIPMVGEFVIPDLLGGSETLMLGRVLWSEFFGNRDWPLAAAIALATTAILLVPILLFRALETRRIKAGL